MKFDTTNIRQKVVIAGPVVRIVKYVSPFPRKAGRKSKPMQKTVHSAAEYKAKLKKNRIYSIQRDYLRISDIINANYGYHGEFTKFFTLTFAGDAGLVEANRKFNLFVKRVNTYLGRKLLYIAVPEFQRRGAVHYHVIVFNFPYIKGSRLFHRTINRLWPYGFIKGQRIYVSYGLEPVINYMTKYIRIQKPDPRFRNKKKFFCSRGLHQPQEMVNSSVEKEVNIHLLRRALRRFPVKIRKTDNEFLGELITEEFTINEERRYLSRELLDSVPLDIACKLPLGSPLYRSL